MLPGLPLNIGMVLTDHKTVTMFMRYVHTEDNPVRAAADAVTLRRQTLIGGLLAVPAPEPAILLLRLVDGVDFGWPFREVDRFASRHPKVFCFYCHCYPFSGERALDNLQAGEQRNFYDIQNDCEGRCRCKRFGHGESRQGRHRDSADGQCPGDQDIRYGRGGDP